MSTARCATLNVAMGKESENWVKFGNWVQERRAGKGLRQEDLAELVGFSDRQSIYRIEKGASTKRSTVIEIAKALDASPEEALNIAFGMSEDAPDKADRAAQAAFMSEAVEELTLMPTERRAQALAMLKVLRAQQPEAIQISGPDFEGGEKIKYTELKKVLPQILEELGKTHDDD